jgi:hypothetical protein
VVAVALVVPATLAVLVAHQVAASVVQYQVAAVATLAANAIRRIARAQFAHQMRSKVMVKDVDVAAKVAKAQAF